MKFRRNQEGTTLRLLFDELEVGDTFVYAELPGSMEVYMKLDKDLRVNLATGKMAPEEDYQTVFPVTSELTYSYQQTLVD